MTPRLIKKFYGRLDARRIPFTVITPLEAMELFRKVKPDDRVVVFTRTEAREVRKAGVPYPYRDCVVLKRREVTLNKGYEEAVNERRAAEGKTPDFRAARRSYGESIGLPFVEHAVGGRELTLYLALHVEKEVGREYWSSDMRVALDPGEVGRYLRPPRKRSRQGLDREVRYVNYRLLNVLAVILPGPRGGPRGFVIDVTAAPPSKRVAAKRGRAGSRRKASRSTR